jgi:hypothetical protein
MIISNCEVPTACLEMEDNINSIIHFVFIPEGATVNICYKEALDVYQSTGGSSWRQTVQWTEDCIHKECLCTLCILQWEGYVSLY